MNINSLNNRVEHQYCLCKRRIYVCPTFLAATISYSMFAIVCKRGEVLHFPVEKLLKWPYIANMLSADLSETNSQLIDLSDWLSADSVNHIYRFMSGESNDILKLINPYVPREYINYRTPLFGNTEMMEELREKHIPVDFYMWELYDYRGLFGIDLKDHRLMISKIFNSIMYHYDRQKFLPSSSLSSINYDEILLDTLLLALLYEPSHRLFQKFKPRLINNPEERDVYILHAALTLPIYAFVVIIPMLKIKFEEYFRLLLQPPYEIVQVQRLYDIVHEMRNSCYSNVLCVDCDICIDESPHAEFLRNEWHESCYCYMAIRICLRTILACTNRDLFVRMCVHARDSWTSSDRGCNYSGAEEFLKISGSRGKCDLKMLHIFCQDAPNAEQFEHYPVWDLSFEQFEIIVKYCPSLFPKPGDEYSFEKFDKYIFANRKDKQNRIVQWILNNVELYKGWR